jgi:hypothetical protein
MFTPHRMFGKIPAVVTPQNDDRVVGKLQSI